MYKISIKYNTKFAFILAILLYVLIVVSIFYGIKKELEITKKYTNSLDSYMDVVMVDRANDDRDLAPEKDKIEEKVPVIEEKQEIKEEVKTSNKETQQEESPDIKSLFSDVQLENLKKPKQNDAVQVRKPTESKNANQKSAKSIIDSLNKGNEVKKQNKQNTGEYNAFWGEVSGIIESRWRAYKVDSKFSAEVILVIDKFGKLSYNIKSLSPNTNFNQKVRDFLENLADVEFPKPPGGGSISHHFKLSDKLD